MSKLLERKTQRSIEAELDRWSGITYEFGERRRHACLTISGPSGKKFVTLSSSPSCPRSMKNAISTIRLTLKETGAVKL